MCDGRADKTEKTMRKWVFLSLGSNLGDRAARIREAVSSLNRLGVRIQLGSALYETEPVGPVEQPWFLNAVVAGETELNPRGLLSVCKRIEREMGRKKGVRFGPRVVDIDILLYGQQVIDEGDLLIPHPQMHRRKFMLIPLIEIAPNIRDPKTGKSFSEILNGLKEGKKVKKLKAKTY
jgi:2-amino-4-hydroxy-6-hydroxymethyldihydropteridine diphosphokinase